MADNPGIINSQIQHRDYTPHKFNSLMELFGKGADAGAANFRTRQDNEAAADRLDTQGDQKQAELATQGKNQLANTTLEGQNHIASEQEAGNQARQTHLAGLNDAQTQMMKLTGETDPQAAWAKFKQGASGASLGPDHLSVTPDHTAANMLAMTKADSAAAGKGQDFYNKNMEDMLKRSGELARNFSAINDPKNPMALGQARAFATTLQDLSRYNDQEGNVTIPETVQGLIAQLGTKTDNPNNPLSQGQVQALNRAIADAAQVMQRKHSMVQQQALGTYQANAPFANEGRMATLKKGWAANGLDDTLSNIQKGASGVAAQAPPPDSGGLVKQVGGGLQSLFRPLTGGPANTPNMNTAQQQAPKQSGLQMLFGGAPKADANTAAPSTGGAGGPPPGLSFEDFQAWKRQNAGNQGAQ